jgi:hypothetical protein
MEESWGARPNGHRRRERCNVIRSCSVGAPPRSDMSISSRAVAYAMSALADQAMPSEEIAAMVRAHDPELVRRYLELHRERLEERLADQQRTLDLLERLLIAAWGCSGTDQGNAIEDTRTAGSYRMQPNGEATSVEGGRHDQRREQHHHPGR